MTVRLPSRSDRRHTNIPANKHLKGAMAYKQSDSDASPRQGSIYVKLILVYACALTVLSVYQTGRQLTAFSPEVETQLLQSMSAPKSGWDPLNPLAIPAGKAQNLPSVRVEDSNVDKKRKIYGGAGDKKHLGGFTQLDLHGVSPSVWKHMIEKLGIHSLLDVGCGRGTSTLWFLTHGVDILCAEGSHDAVEKSMLPDPANQIVEHDFSRGPWWPEKTYDAAWAVEFLEHVNLQFQFNYVTAFRKAALLFVTSSRNGGWHHVETHLGKFTLLIRKLLWFLPVTLTANFFSDEWWIRKYESYGFRYSPELTKEIRDVAIKEKSQGKTAPNGEPYNAQHVWLTMKVFINPMVAALPQHAHLFPELGCYEGRDKGQILHRECGTGRSGALETPLAPSFFPLKLTPEMDAKWENILKSNLDLASK